MKYLYIMPVDTMHNLCYHALNDTNSAWREGVIQTNKRLRSLREGMGLSQMEFAAKVGVSLRSAYAYAYGERRPSPEVAKRIADLFNLTIEEIWKMFYADTDD